MPLGAGLDGSYDATYHVVDGGPNALGLVPSAENMANLRTRHETEFAKGSVIVSLIR
jgi:hypothetical protein